jgi:VanZ family protein
MPEFFLTESRARLRTWLALGYALFIVYASLSPFTGWRGQGLSFIAVLQQPLLLTYTAFDAILNLLSYLPLGLLLGLALRARLRPLPSLICACVLGISLSVGMEYLQMYLPTRTSSNLDILTNASGTLIGTLLALSFTRWTHAYNLLASWRDHTFLHGKRMDFGLALLALWMFGQINPSLPMLGNVFISEVAHQPFATAPNAPFDLWESAAVLLNLLMLGTLLLTLLRNRVTVISILLLVLVSVAVMKFVTAAVLLKSSAMLLWVNSEAMLGILLGSVLLLMSRRMAYGNILRFGALMTIAYIVVAHFILDSTPAAAMSVYHWHYGHLLNYNGLAQTITLVFPVLLLLHLYRVRNV